MIVTEELIEVEQNEAKEEIWSFNHSYICTEILLQLSQNPKYKPLVKLTLDVDKGLTPDISVYPKEKIKPNFFQDITKYPEMPILAVEIISASQNTQDLLDKAKTLIQNNVKAVWTVEPFTNTVFVTTKDGEKRFRNQEVESEGIKVDFQRTSTIN